MSILFLLTNIRAEPFDFDAVKAKSEKMKSETLVFKGFYLGMPVADAQVLLNHYLKLKQVSSEPTTPPELTKEQQLEEIRKGLLSGLLGKENPQESLRKTSFYIFKNEENFLVQQDPDDRPFALADENGKVVAFELSEPIRNAIFESKDIPIKEFLQSFGDAYGIPKRMLIPTQIEIKSVSLSSDAPEKVGFQTIFQHRSPKGFELTYWDDLIIFKKDVNYSLAAPIHSLTLKLIEDGEKRKSKFN